ncbi:CoA-binding protein [Candidatus Bathyarchaeota archaeon]|nr:CoA-binding protein [Candidatus Bathyarchaeota archaeon]
MCERGIDMSTSRRFCESIRSLFDPESVAVVGATENPEKPGYLLLRNLIDLGYRGKIYPVNRGRETVLGLKCYPRVNEIPGEVETAVIIVPAKEVPKIMEDCGDKKVRSVIICSSGFGEAGGDGAKLEKMILEIASRHGIRIVGPNTTGILNTYNGFTSSFVKLSKPVRGPVSIIAQTGMFASAMLEHILTTQPYGLSKVAGLGNKVDVEDSDILEYLEGDPDTRVVAIYAEGIRDGRRFIEVSRRVSPKKPIIILKSARTRSGGRAAETHTGSLMVRDEIFDAACRAAGIIRAGDIEELLDYTKAFAMSPPPRGDRVGVIAYTGAGCVMSADAIEDYGLRLAELSEETMETLRTYTPPFGVLSNPLDAELIRMKVGNAEESMKLSLEAFMRDPNVNMVSLVMVGLRRGSKIWEVDFRRVFSKIGMDHPEKPLVATIMASREVTEEFNEEMARLGVPTYPSLHRNIRALSALARYHLKYGTSNNLQT